MILADNSTLDKTQLQFVPSPAPLRMARYHVQYGGWHIFPVHVPVFDDDGKLLGCTCETYRTSPACEADHPHLYLGPDGKCAQPGKCPAVKWGSKATADDAQLVKWWGRPWLTHPATPGRRYYPNFGGDCGKSGKLTLDADLYKDNYRGGAFLSGLDEETVTHLSGSGGAHLVYTMPEGKHYSNASGTLPEGIDIRGVGGYVVLPGSLHHSGRTYTFETGYAPHEIAYVQTPSALQEILDKAHGNRGRGPDGRAAAGPSDAAAVNESLDYVFCVLSHGNIAHSPAQAWAGDGRKVILQDCPFNPEDNPHAPDAASFVVVYPDGKIGAGCHHARCQKVIEDAGGNGWAMLREKTGYRGKNTFDAAAFVAYQTWLATPGAITQLKQAGFRNPERARKLLDALLEYCTTHRTTRATPGYAWLSEQTLIARGGLGRYLVRLAENGFLEIKAPEKEGDATGFNLVFHNVNTLTQEYKLGVHVVKNWNIYREHRPDEAFIQNHAAYIQTRPNAELAPLGDNALGIVTFLQEGAATTTNAAAATGYSYQAAARVFRRMAEHGLVDVEVGQRNRKIYTLKPDWRERLNDNRRRMTTYGLPVERRYRSLKQLCAYLSRKEGAGRRYEAAQVDLKRALTLLRWIRTEAGILHYVPPEGGALQARLRRLTDARLAGERAEHRRSRPRVATAGEQWRKQEYAQRNIDRFPNLILGCWPGNRVVPILVDGGRYGWPRCQDHETGKIRWNEKQQQHRCIKRNVPRQG